MGRKPKFKPRITRIKLNPEQAVLQCKCFDAGLLWTEELSKAGARNMNACTNEEKGGIGAKYCETMVVGFAKNVTDTEAMS